MKGPAANDTPTAVTAPAVAEKPITAAIITPIIALNRRAVIALNPNFVFIRSFVFVD
ncbi:MULTISPECIES: hypothetical protein [Bacteroidales]|uniref:hypothetical protein n=1 Tax=Bacteroidales TaxID=171549 RepID=UPI00256EE06A|nr:MULTISPECIES: hypothetical protein [Bacteroidales]